MEVWNGWLKDVGTTVTHYAGAFAEQARNVIDKAENAEKTASAFVRSHEGQARLACEFAGKISFLKPAADSCLAAIAALDTALETADAVERLAEQVTSAAPPALPAKPAKKKK